MPLLTTLLGFIPSLISATSDHLKTKAELRKVQATGEIKLAEAEINAKIARAQANDAADNDLDSISLKDRGYKDDYLLFLTTSPLVLLFLSPLLSINSVVELQAAVLSGFAALEKTPEYYWWALGIIYIDTFGFRRFFRQLIEKRFGA